MKIAVDTSSFVAFLAGEKAQDVSAIAEAIENEQLTFPPVVVSELLSHLSLNAEDERLICSLPTLNIQEGFWERVGRNRAQIIKAGHKARLADSMIATFCLDNQVPLITRDNDFRHFEKEFGLRINTIT